MKKIVWENKSNGQLCVTIPKSSGMKEGDIVSIEKEKMRTIVYTPITGDLLHYGHLRLLENANKLGDLHICGVLADEAIGSYKELPVAALRERMAIISALRCVDMVMIQSHMDPTENLEKLHEQFKEAKLMLVYGSNWKETPGSIYIKKIGGEVVQPPFYTKLSQQKIMNKLLKNRKRKEEK